MDFTLFWSIFVILGISYFAIAMAASRNIATKDDFFYGGRSFGIWPLSLTLAVIHIGGGMLLTTPSNTYKYGYFGFFYSFGIFLGFLLLSLVAPRFKRENLKTIAELFSKKYGSLGLRRFASFLSIMTMSGLFIAQIVVSRKVITYLADGYQFILVIFWLVVIFYTMLGGLRAVLATESFQMLFIVATFLFITFLLLNDESISIYIPKNLSQLSMIGDYFSPISRNQGLVLLIMPMLYSVLAQDLGQRFFAARTPLIAGLSALLAGALVLAFASMPVLFGILARMLDIYNVEDSIVLQLFSLRIEKFFYYLLICAMIAAISSTADALLCAIGSNWVEDFVLANYRDQVDQYVALMVSRISVFFIGISSLIIAFYIEDLLFLLMVSYELSISCLLVPILFSLLLSKPRYESALLSVLMGLFGFFIVRHLGLFEPKEFVGLLCSFAGYIMGYLLLIGKQWVKV